ncbi:MAG TPA: ATP-binding protein [Solirubrobacterales bacterium]|nr:ATP-binding protein [Solirubrobacterales bacterium]
MAWSGGNGGRPEGPRVGMRLWLGVAFATVGVITAASVYLMVRDSSERVLSERSTELALGRTVALADRLGGSENPEELIRGSKSPGFHAWYFDVRGVLVAPDPAGPLLRRIANRDVAVDTARAGGRFEENIGGELTVVAAPVFTDSKIAGAVLARYSREEVLQDAIDQLGDDSLRALAIAVFVGVLAGFVVASAIAVRVKRLAASAERMASGSLDPPLDGSGRDEIGDLARALESMRASLKESFGVLTADRDKLAAIFDGLTDAVMVVDREGRVRFSNQAAKDLLDEDGQPPEVIQSHLRRAAEAGFAAHPALRVGDRAYALQVRDLPAESAVLAISRDRTDEMRREWAERDFVSNAAHELRNPLAGISGAIEVLQGGAKDDPEARDHFISRLEQDAERMSRLTQSLLTLARVESLGASEAEIVDVDSAVSDVVKAVKAPEGIELTVEVEPGLAAKGDPTLLRQVLIGLLTNAYKNTPEPGAVTVRGRRDGTDGVMLEVTDTGSGIPTDEVERVFERFYRRSESRTQEGFGLGLAIARRMVSVMGGEIGASSVEGEGSTFWVRLPVTQIQATSVA